MFKRLAAIFTALMMILFVFAPAASALGAKVAPAVSAVSQEAVSLNITESDQVIDGTYFVKVGLFKNYKALTIQLGYLTSLPPENIAKVEWSSSDKHIVIDQTGKCKATKNGKCSSKITLKITDTDGKTYQTSIVMKLYKFSWDKYKTNY